MFMLPPFALLRRMAEPTPFLPPFFPSREIPSFWGTSIIITFSGTQKVLPIPVGRKYSIGSPLLTSSTSMTLTNLLFSIAHFLTSPLLPLLLPYLAPGRCFRIWALITYQFLQLSLFLPNKRPLQFSESSLG